MKLRNLALAALLPLVAVAAGVSIQLDNGTIRVTGWEPAGEPAQGWDSVFSVTVRGQGQAQPVFGSTAVENGTFVFRPRYPLTPGVTYQATFVPPGGDVFLNTLITVPAAAVTDSPTKVAAVYPTSDTIPDNQLKFYVVFSAPMQRGDVWPNIHLIDETGKAVALPFIELPQELWDREQKRLTILFDPGRIKRGVGINEQLGPVLTEGRRYTLVIDRELSDAHGRPLAETFRRTFTVGPAERRGIDLKRWKINEPRKGTTDPLIIRFDRPLDYALLQHVFTVQGVAGTGTVESAETGWRFQPAQAWKADDYNLIIDMTLEDLAGNRIGRPFDVDTLDNPTDRISKSTTTLPIRVR